MLKQRSGRNVTVNVQCHPPSSCPLSLTQWEEVLTSLPQFGLHNFSFTWLFSLIIPERAVGLSALQYTVSLLLNDIRQLHWNMHSQSQKICLLIKTLVQIQALYYFCGVYHKAFCCVMTYSQHWSGVIKSEAHWDCSIHGKNNSSAVIKHYLSGAGGCKHSV